MTEYKSIKIPTPLADVIDDLVKSEAYSSRAEYVKETLRNDLRKREILGGAEDADSPGGTQRLKVRRLISAVWRFITPERHDLAMLIIIAIIGLELAVLFLFVYWAFLLFFPVMAIFLVIVYVCYLSIDLWRGRQET